MALSFAGAQRDYVGQVAAALKAQGVRCFYDEDEQVRLWGTHLAEELPRIYAQESAAVVVFISVEYAGQEWTRLERRAALARAVAEAGVYVLPARFDDSELPGLLPDVVTIDLRRLTPVQFAGLVADKVAELPGGPRAGAGPAAAGRPLAEMRDPFVLEVHRPVLPEDAPAGLPELPPYIPRGHDQVLAQAVRAAAAGRSGIAVLVGGSSTGKTRACWEALSLLRNQDPPWRVWHPIDPTRPDAALRELPRIGPRTMVWLNEAQFYLDVADGGLGERVAAGLRELLRDPGRAPVLVLATLWPQYWDTLTARPASASVDSHAQARDLLAGHDIPVPAAFTPVQVGQLAGSGDARLVLAARLAADREVIQFLAGAPELLARYRNAPPAAAALISVAMDARRLGMGAGLPRAFLEAAAPGHLTLSQWDALDEDWLEQALVYAAVPCKGARGPLTLIRRRPAASRAPRSGPRDSGMQPAAGPGGVTGGPLYRLADYLDQHARQHRESQIPPPEFWAAAAAHAMPTDQAAFGDAAHNRGLYRDAAQLHKNAAAHGNLDAALYLSHPPDCLRADPRPAHWAAARVSLSDPVGVARLLNALREAGAAEQAAALASRAAASAPLDHPVGVARLLGALREAGAAEQAAALLRCDPAARVSLDHPGDVAILLDRLREAGAAEQAAALASRAAASAPLDHPVGVARLLDRLREAGAAEQAAALLRRDPAARVSLDDPSGVAILLGALRKAGAAEQAAALASRAAAHISLDHPGGVARLLDRLREAGAAEQAAALLRRDPAARVSLDDPSGVAILLDRLREAGAAEQAAALASRAAASAPLDHPVGVAILLDRLREAGAAEQAAALASRAAAHISLDHPGGVARLLDRLREAGAAEQAAALLRRDPAAHVSLDHPGDVAILLGALRKAGAAEQAAALASRAAASAPLDHPGGVGRLLGALREAGAAEQAAALLRRDPAARVSLDHPVGVAILLDRLQEAGAAEQAAALASRAAASAPLDHPGGVARLLGALREAGAAEQAAALLRRDPAARVSLDHPGDVAILLDRLRKAGAAEQAAALARRAAASAPLDHPGGVARLLDRLRQAGAAEQAAALLRRDPAARVSLDDPGDVAFLLNRLRKAGAAEQAAALASRLAEAGMFRLFLEQQDGQDRFWFGRQADGSPSEPWGWDDLA